MSKPFSSVSHRYRHYLLYPLLSLFVALGIGIWPPAPSQAIPWAELLLRGVQIFELSNISNKEEVQLGKQINQQLVSSEVQLYRNPQVNRYIDQLGQRLAPNSSRPDLPFTFQVVKDESVNAFATTGGFVYINTGLLKAADNEAQLASVIAHEIGHITNRHLIKQMQETAIAQGVATTAGLDNNTAVQIGVDLALSRPNSRQDEFEADKTGLELLRRSGYAESAIVAFMEKLLKQGSSVPTFLSRHPATKDRIARLKREIDPQKADRDAGLDEAAYRAKIRPLL